MPRVKQYRSGRALGEKEFLATIIKAWKKDWKIYFGTQPWCDPDVDQSEHIESMAALHVLKASNCPVPTNVGLPKKEVIDMAKFIVSNGATGRVPQSFANVGVVNCNGRAISHYINEDQIKVLREKEDQARKKEVQKVVREKEDQARKKEVQKVLHEKDDQTMAREKEAASEHHRELVEANDRAAKADELLKEARRKAQAAEARAKRAATAPPAYTAYREPPKSQKSAKKSARQAKRMATQDAALSELKHQVHILPEQKQLREASAEASKQLAHAEAEVRKAKERIQALKNLEADMSAAREAATHYVPPASSIGSVVEAAMLAK